MYYRFVHDNQIEYSLYILTLIRHIILQDTSEYDKLNILFVIPKLELDYFLECKSYMMKRRKTKFFERKKEDFLLINQKLQFSESLKFIDRIIEEYSPNERTDILRKIIYIIYKDISSDYAAGIFYKKHPPNERLGVVPFPLYDESHTKLEIDDFIISTTSTLDLSSDNVIIDPMWNRASVKKCIDFFQKKPWVYSKTNHSAYKYSVIDIGHVYNGRHSSTLGQIYKQGIIENVKLIDTEKLYKYIYTDGVNWYNIFDKSAILENHIIHDIRFPLIFEIGRKLIL